MLSKNLFRSKTIWANGLALIAAVAGPILAEWVGYTGEVPSELTPFVLPAILVINLGLRYFFTNSSLRGG